MRLVAVFEAAKGGIVILVGLGLPALIHRNLQDVAEHVVRHFHLNPASNVPRIFLELSSSLNERRLWILAVAAVVYAMVRFVEAVGLWRRRRWAQWFGIISGGIYLPIEVYELIRSISVIKISLLLTNLMIVVLLFRARLRVHRD